MNKIEYLILIIPNIKLKYPLNFNVFFPILYQIPNTMNRIKEVLNDKGIKQTWLANKLGKSYNVVNGYVTNKRQPSIEVLYEIAKLLQVEAKELLN